MKTLKFLTLFLAASCVTVFGQITQSLVLPATATASKGTITACVSDCRIEGDLHSWGALDNSSIFTTGIMASQYLVGNNGIIFYWVQGNAGTGPCVGAVPPFTFTNLTQKALKFRFQVSVAGNALLAGGAPMTSVIEIWDSLVASDPVYTQTCIYTSLVGTPGAGATFGDAGSSLSQSSDFFREYPNLVAPGSQMPVTAPTVAYAVAPIFDWKFDNNLNDSSGNGFTATYAGSGPTYASTDITFPIQTLVASRPRTASIPFAGSQETPVWSNWISLKVGVVNQLDCTQSFSQAAASSAVSCLWAQASGATVTLSSTSATQPTLVPPSFGPYGFTLQVTDTNANMATAALDLGAVSMDANHVVIPTDSVITEVLGPQIAFGQNPWGYQDERNLYTANAQIAFQASTNDFSWTTSAQGTISYPFAGIGVAPGQTGTTLCGSTSCNGTGITATDTSISIADASKITGLTHLPTWILIGNSNTTFEMIRVTATTATTGNATLTVAYDGRGMAGNLTAFGGFPNVVSAQSWTTGTIVGEYRIDGTGTLFNTDSSRPLCPAGVPGPIGPVIYSTGSVQMTGGSTTITGVGTAWTSDTIGADAYGNGWIRVTATHASGTSYVYWAQIVSVNTGAQTMVVSRPAPIGTDAATNFSYKITGRIYFSLDFLAPTGEIARLLKSGVGCESETAAFALLTQDVPALDTTTQTGQNISYKNFLSEVGQNNLTYPNFYGSGGLMPLSFYQRSGLGTAKTLADSINQNWVRDPELGDGYAGGQPLELGGGVIGAMADLVINPMTTPLTWANVAAYASSGEVQATACNATDTRDGGYIAAFLTLAANYDTDLTRRASWRNALGLSSPSMLSRDQDCKRNASDGYTGSELNSFANSFTFNPTGSGSPAALTLATNSKAVTGTGFTNGLAGTYPNYSGSVAGYCWGIDIVTVTVTQGLNTFTVASGTLTQANLLYINGTRSGGSTQYTGIAEYLVSGSSGTLAYNWPGDSGTFEAMSTGGGPIVGGGQVIGGLGSIWTDNNENFAANEALREPWACKYNSPTSLTLFRNWTAASGGSYHISYYNTGASGQQPFFVGVKVNQMRWASLNSNSTIANGYGAIKLLTGEWYNLWAWDSGGGKGTFYDAVWKGCGDPTDVAAGDFQSIHSYQGCGTSGLATGAVSVARVNSAEGGAAMIQYFISECPTGGTTPQCNTARSTVDSFYGAIFGRLDYCDASVASTCDNTTASALDNASMAYYKWPGFYFGMGSLFTSSWPAIRVVSSDSSNACGKFCFGGKFNYGRVNAN